MSAHASSVVPCQPDPQLFVFLPGQENQAISHLVTSLYHSEPSGLTTLPIEVILSGARKYVLGPNFQSIYIVRTNHMWEFWFLKLFGKAVATSKMILISFVSHLIQPEDGSRSRAKISLQSNGASKTCCSTVLGVLFHLDALEV